MARIGLVGEAARLMTKLCTLVRIYNAIAFSIAFLETLSQVSIQRIQHRSALLSNSFEECLFSSWESSYTLHAYAGAFNYTNHADIFPG